MSVISVAAEKVLEFKMIYRKLTVPSFSAMRAELEQSTATKILEPIRYWDTEWPNIKPISPTLYSFINSKRKTLIRHCRFYLTPPNGILPPHIDGSTAERSPLSLIVPIVGFENTKMTWYDNSPDNFEDHKTFGYTTARTKNPMMLTKIEETVIDTLTFVRTDVVHAISNPNPTCRLILSIRFNFNKETGNQFNEVFDLADL